MFSYKIFCGTDTNGHNVDAESIIKERAAKYFPNGHTVYYADGRWIGEVGVINERTIVVEFLTDNRLIDERRVSQFAADFKRYCYQESVLVTCQELDAWFV